MNTSGMQALSTGAALTSLMDSLWENTHSIPQLLDSIGSTSLLENEFGMDNSSTENINLSLLAPHRHSPNTNDNQIVSTSSASSGDFRMGGLGRSRGRQAQFQMSRVRGMYDDADVDDVQDDEHEAVGNVGDVSDESQSVSTTTRKGDMIGTRRRGTVVFVPRPCAGGEGGWLCFVEDAEIVSTRRAWALRTIMVATRPKLT